MAVYPLHLPERQNRWTAQLAGGCESSVRRVKSYLGRRIQPESELNRSFQKVPLVGVVGVVPVWVHAIELVELPYMADMVAAALHVVVAAGFGQGLLVMGQEFGKVGAVADCRRNYQTQKGRVPELALFVVVPHMAFRSGELGLHHPRNGGCWHRLGRIGTN